MSKDMLGSVTRALVGVPNEYLGVTLDFANKLGGKDGARWKARFAEVLRGGVPFVIEVVDGVTYITVISDGRTAEDFIRLWEKHYRLSTFAKDITLRARFTPTMGVVYRIPIIMGSEFSNDNRITSKIREEATRRHYRTLPFEAACLLREAVSDEDLERLGLWWLIGMHDPVKDSGGPSLLGVPRIDGGRWVNASYGHPGRRWDRGRGFAFLAPQDQS
jgi:hypothetical protein